MMKQQRAQGVTIVFDEGNGLVPEESDYCQLLGNMSRIPPPKLVLFESRVGLARVALLAGALGIIFGVHCTVLLLGSLSPVVFSWCVYACFMCIYHWSEFLVTCVYHPHLASFDSFLVNQSLQYGIALVVSWGEFWVTSLLAPRLKSDSLLDPAITWMGIGLIVLGQTCRTMSMIQAGPGFTHQIAFERAARHELVTHGVYKYLRHPGYFGWFYWSLGTQLLLGNPICLVCYFMVARSFFVGRIPVEEEQLYMLFGDEYLAYKARTIIGIPGIGN